MLGNDGASGNPAVTNEFFSFNNMKFMGTVGGAPATQTPAAQTPAAQTPAAQTPAAQTPTPQTPAPQTGDAMMLFIILGILGAAGIVAVRKVLR